MPCQSDLQNGKDNMDPTLSIEPDNENSPISSDDEKLPLLLSKTAPSCAFINNNTDAILSRSLNEDPEIETLIFRNKHQRLLNWKDILVLSMACFSHNFGYFGILFNLSSLHADDADLAFITLASVSAIQVIGSLFLATFLIQRIGCKCVLIVATASNLVLSLAQFHPSYWTFIPGGLVLGVGNLCALVVLGTYVSIVSESQVGITGKRLDTTLGWYYGLVNMFRYGGGLVVNLVSYSLLSSEKGSIFALYNITNKSVDHCGFHYCNEPLEISDTKLKAAENNERLLYIIFAVAACCGPIISLFLGSRDDIKTRSLKINIWKQCKNTIRALCDYRMAMITLTFLNAGLLRGFITGDYANGYILCSIDISTVSLSATVLNITYVAMAMLGGLLNSLFGIRWSMIINSSIPIAIYIYLMVMDINSEHAITIFLVISATVGAVLGVYNTLSSTLLSLFCEDKEIGFSIYRMSFELGSASGYIWSNYLCMDVKLPILLVMNIIGIITYQIAMSKMPKYQRMNPPS